MRFVVVNDVIKKLVVDCMFWLMIMDIIIRKFLSVFSIMELMLVMFKVIIVDR